MPEAHALRVGLPVQIKIVACGYVHGGAGQLQGQLHCGRDSHVIMWCLPGVHAHLRGVMLIAAPARCNHSNQKKTVGGTQLGTSQAAARQGRRAGALTDHHSHHW